MKCSEMTLELAEKNQGAKAQFCQLLAVGLWSSYLPQYTQLQK